MVKINVLQKELEAAVKKINNKEKLIEDLKDLQEKKDIQVIVFINNNYVFMFIFTSRKGSIVKQFNLN